MSRGTHKRGRTADGKRRRMADVGNGEDLISNLPDGILDQILSFLTTKEAARTCVLSKYWECKWTSVCNVIINDTEFLCPGKCATSFFKKKSARKSFRNFLEKTLTSYPRNIKNFQVSCKWYKGFKRMTTWISNVLRCKIESLTIIASMYSNSTILPNNIFKCTSLVNLDLDLDCTLRSPPYNLLPNLKTLSLQNVEVLNENSNTDTLNYDFPNLETFNLQGCKWLNVKCVEFHVPSLTKFKSGTYCSVGFDDYSIKIVGARCTEYVHYGDLENFNLCTSQVSSAHLYHIFSYKDFGLQALKLLEGFVNVESLYMSPHLTRAIAQSKSRLHILGFHRLECLNLDDMLDVSTLTEFLYAMPSLKFLTMRECDDGKLEYTDEDDNNVMGVPPCFRNSLEEIRWRSYRGKANHVLLAKYLLKNGVKLKEAYFFARCSAKKADIEAIKTYPRGSTNLKLYLL